MSAALAKLILLIGPEVLPLVVEAIEAISEGRKLKAARKAYEAARRIALNKKAEAYLG